MLRHESPLTGASRDDLHHRRSTCVEPPSGLSSTFTHVTVTTAESTSVTSFSSANTAGTPSKHSCSCSYTHHRHGNINSHQSHQRSSTRRICSNCIPQDCRIQQHPIPTSAVSLSVHSLSSLVKRAQPPHHVIDNTTRIDNEIMRYTGCVRDNEPPRPPTQSACLCMSSHST